MFGDLFNVIVTIWADFMNIHYNVDLLPVLLNLAIERHFECPCYIHTTTKILIILKTSCKDSDFTAFMITFVLRFKSIYAKGQIHDLSQGREEGRGFLFAKVALCPAFRRPLRRGYGRMGFLVLLQQEGERDL